MLCVLCHAGIQTPQLKLGQSYLCMSLDTDNLNTVAKVVTHEGVIVFGSDMAGISNLPRVDAISDKPVPSKRFSCRCTDSSASPSDLPSLFVEGVDAVVNPGLQGLLEVERMIKSIASTLPWCTPACDSIILQMVFLFTWLYYLA